MLIICKVLSPIILYPSVIISISMFENIALINAKPYRRRPPHMYTAKIKTTLCQDAGNAVSAYPVYNYKIGYDDILLNKCTVHYLCKSV
jgi:hypothetical protein